MFFFVFISGQQIDVYEKPKKIRLFFDPDFFSTLSTFSIFFISLPRFLNLFSLKETRLKFYGSRRKYTGTLSFLEYFVCITELVLSEEAFKYQIDVTSLSGIVIKTNYSHEFDLVTEKLKESTISPSSHLQHS